MGAGTGSCLTVGANEIDGLGLNVEGAGTGGELYWNK